MMRVHDARRPVALGLLFAVAVSALIWGGAYLVACWLVGGLA